MSSTRSVFNVKRSFERFSDVDIEDEYGVTVIFDPDNQKEELRDLTEWIEYLYTGSTVGNPVSELTLNIFCMRRSDPNDYNLWKLRDNVIDALTATGSGAGGVTIPLYDFLSDADNPTQIGGIRMLLRGDSGVQTLADGTRQIIITVSLLWAQKV